MYLDGTPLLKFLTFLFLFLLLFLFICSFVCLLDCLFSNLPTSCKLTTTIVTVFSFFYSSVYPLIFHTFLNIHQKQNWIRIYIHFHFHILALTLTCFNAYTYIFSVSVSSLHILALTLFLVICSTPVSSQWKRSFPCTSACAQWFALKGKLHAGSICLTDWPVALAVSLIFSLPFLPGRLSREKVGREEYIATWKEGYMLSPPWSRGCQRSSLWR